MIIFPPIQYILEKKSYPNAGIISLSVPAFRAAWARFHKAQGFFLTNDKY
jgi:hypothetical protein